MAKKLWASPPSRPIKGTYTAHGYAPYKRFGPREAGSVFEDAALSAIWIPLVAVELEMLAQRAEMGSTPGLVGGLSGVGIFALRIGLKALANYLRRNGESLFRDIGAWLWLWIESWFGWNKPPGPPRPPAPPRPGIFQRLFGWRRRRRIMPPRRGWR